MKRSSQIGEKTMKKFLAFGILLFAISGCENLLFDDDNEPPFTVTVLSKEGEPVEGAILEGGFDWDWFRVETDDEGTAMVPGCGLGESTTIFKNNYSIKNHSATTLSEGQKITERSKLLYEV